MGEEKQPERKKREPAIMVAILTTAGALLGTIITTGGGLLTGLLKPGDEAAKTVTVTVHVTPTAVAKSGPTPSTGGSPGRNGEAEQSLLELEPLSSGDFRKDPAKVSGQLVEQALVASYAYPGGLFTQSYLMPADYRTFHATVGIDDRSNGEGPVTFEVMDADGKPLITKSVRKGRTEEISAAVEPGKKFSLHATLKTGAVANVAWLRPVLRK